jgi:predicted DNA-binding protein (MmcQ/YjbR family)
VHDKIFVTFSNNHHGDGRLAITCNAPGGVQDALVSADPVNYFVPPYVGKGGWLGVRLDCGLPDSTVAALIEQAHQTTASRLRRGKRRGSTPFEL